MATLNGKAAVWGNGVSGATLTAMLFGADSDTGKFSSTTNTDFERFADKAELQDYNGDTIGAAYYAHGKRFTVTAVPADRVAMTEAAAIIQQDLMLPAPGTVIYIQDFNSTVTDGLFATGGPTPTGGISDAARYVCTGCRLRKTNTSFSVIEMDLVQYDSYDISTIIT